MAYGLWKLIHKGHEFRMWRLWPTVLTFSYTCGLCRNYWQRLCEYCSRSQDSDWHAKAQGVTKWKENTEFPYGRRLLMSDTVTFTGNDFSPAEHTAFEYILTTERLKTDCRSDTVFEKEVAFGTLSIQKENLIFFKT